MAMRVCIYCKQDITYERENRNMLRDGVVGFWTSALTGQATCPLAPVDEKGQQLHNAGDVHTPPVHDPAELEKFLDGTYVPPVPAEPCGQVYGMDDQGGFLMCGLDKEHSGDCAPGDQVKVQEVVEQRAQAEHARDSADVVPESANFDVQQNGDIVTVSASMDGLSITLEFDTSKVVPAQVVSMLQQFPQPAYQAVMAVLTGVDPTVVQQIQEAEKDAQKPEAPKKIDLDDPDGIEKFLRDE